MRKSIAFAAVGVAAAFFIPYVNAGGDPTQVSFEQDVMPILNRHCVSCHMPGAALGDLELYPDPHGKLVGVPSTQSPLALIEEGDPEKSYFYHKLLNTQESVDGSGAVMPFQQPPLRDEQIEKIRAWIEQGAADN